MRKQLLAFLIPIFLCACATGAYRQTPAAVKPLQTVNFFKGGNRLAAFKVVGRLNDNALDGVLQLKKIGEEDFDVQLLTVGGYRVLHATVTEENIAYRYLFSDVDNNVVRGRITQFLNLLLYPNGPFERYRVKGDTTTVTRRGNTATHKLMYHSGEVYPFAAQTVTALNTADLKYDEYAPASAEGNAQIPHLLIYKDGKITLELVLISLK